MNTVNNAIVSLLGAGYTFIESGRRTQALSDISLSIAPGEIVALVGPSGSGKSTLLRLCAGLLQTSTGVVRRSSAPMSMVFQDFALLPWLTAEENVEFGLQMQGVGLKERQKIAREGVRELGLTGFEKAFPKALSGGMRQRVGIARALAVEPELLLMDEPLSALDSITADHLKADLLSIWSKRRFAILIVVHTIADAVELADRIVVLSAHPGRIKKIIKNVLPKPRNMRSHDAYALVDEITHEIDGAS